MFLNNLDNYRIILASQSPRRQSLLQSLNIPFEISVKDTEETFPPHLQAGEIATYLARLKADAFEAEMQTNTLLITADTIVWLNGQLLGKPDGLDGARKMLAALSGQKHTVYTGVCLSTSDSQHTFVTSSDVYFKSLNGQEIDYYVDTFKPLDKAGAYGIQEWIGYIGIERIDGSYFNVMGLPVQRLYEELKKVPAIRQ